MERCRFFNRQGGNRRTSRMGYPAHSIGFHNEIGSDLSRRTGIQRPISEKFQVRDFPRRAGPAGLGRRGWIQVFEIVLNHSRPGGGGVPPGSGREGGHGGRRRFFYEATAFFMLAKCSPPESRTTNFSSVPAATSPVISTWPFRSSSSPVSPST